MAGFHDRRTGTFLLVHGAYRGGWIWERLAPLLRGAGHTVHAPTLAGQAERHDAGPQGLAAHVAEIVSLIDRSRLRDVVLAGHSYGGMVITGVAGERPTQIRHLVYLDAPTPRDGQSIFDLMTPERRIELEALARDHGTGEWLPADGSLPNVRDPGIAAWILARLSAQAIATFREPVRITDPAAFQIPRTHVSFTDKSGVESPVSRAARAAHGDPGWRYHEVFGPHDAMVTAPEEVARILLALA